MSEESQRQFVIHHTTDGRSPSECGPGDLYGEVMGHLTPTGGQGMSESQTAANLRLAMLRYQKAADNHTEKQMEAIGGGECAECRELRAEIERLRAELVTMTEDRNRWLLSFGQLSAQVNPVTDAAAWEYVRTRWAEVLERLGDE